MKWSRCYKNIKWKKLYISFIIQYTYCIPSLKVIPILRGTRCQHLFYYVHVPFPYKPNINNTHPFVNRLNVNYKNPHWGYLQTNWEFDHLPLEKEYSTKYAFCNNLQVFEQHLVGAWLQIHKGCIWSCHIYAREPRSRSGCGRPRVGVGGLWILSSYNKNKQNISSYTFRYSVNAFFQLLLNMVQRIKLTCIHVSSMTRSGEDSGDWRGGGIGWINFGTTTKPLPTTSIAPALFAVPK